MDDPLDAGRETNQNGCMLACQPLRTCAAHPPVRTQRQPGTWRSSVIAIMRAALTLFINARGRTRLHWSGFSWLAFISLPLWALRRRLWGLSLLLLALTWLLHSLVDFLLSQLPAGDLQAGLGLAWLLAESWYAGRHANRWHRLLLERRGYVAAATELPVASS